MQRFFAFIKRDAKHVFANVISLVVVVGMIVVPSFYAWFNRRREDHCHARP